MSPRAYRQSQRRTASEQTRDRIVKAAREVLGSRSAASRFTAEAVAHRAGVARMTVYYHFKSKRGLLDALYDDLARRGGIDQLPRAFMQDDPLAALDTYIALFGRFWSRDRLVVRRIRALAALDPEIEASLRERDSWRAAGLTVLVTRLLPEASEDSCSDVVNVLQTLLSFESFDSLAGSRSPEEAVPLVRRVARAVLALG
jgi:AcrR family transcriptional regulator